jgi:uncharacterized protein (TIGR03437 family)
LKTIKKTVFGLGMLMAALVCCLDTASAQTLTASPSALMFTTPAGVTPAPQSFTVSSSPATTVSVSSFPSWVQVSPTSGPTPLTVTVSIGANAPSVTSNGQVTITPATGSPIQVGVFLNVTAGGSTGVLTATPNPLSFSFAPGSTLAQTQSVGIASSNINVSSFTLSQFTSDGGPWLTVANTGNGQLTGNPPVGSISVTVSPNQLPAGTGPFSGTITLNPTGGGQSTTIPVNVTISGTPTLTVAPSSLSFAFQSGTTPPSAQTLNVATSTGANIGFSATTKTSSCGTGWLIVSPQNSSTPGVLTVSVNTTVLPISTCQGEVDITASGVSNTTVAIPVTVLVSSSPLLLVPTPGPTFTYQLNSGIQVPSQNVQIMSSSTAVNFAVALTPVSNGPSFLQVIPTTGTTPQSLMLTVNPLVLATLGPGTYVENVQVSSIGAGNAPSFPVTLVVTNNAVLTSTASALTFNYQIGQTPPSTQTLTINSTGVPLNYTVAATSTTCPGFLSATAFNNLNGFTFGNQNQVVVGVNTNGLTTAQTCTGNLTFTVPGSTTPALVVPVTFNVATTPLLNVGVSSVNVTALPGSAGTSQFVSITSTNPSAPLQFNATAATNPLGLTWLSISPNSGFTPTNLQVTITPGSLAAGVYTGTITISSPSASFPTQTIPVTLTIASANIGVTPTSLSFAQAVGGIAPPFQTLQVSGVPAGTTIGASVSLFNGTGWLTANVAGNTVTVTANGSALSQGSYNGLVTVIVPGAANGPFNVPVTLVVGAAQSLSLSATTVNFSAQVGATAPASQSVQLSSSGSAVPFTATFVAGTNTPATLVTVTPASGMTPNTLVLALNPTILATLPAGTFSGNVNVSSTAIPGGDMAIKVNVTVTPAAAASVASIVNGASFAPGAVSPGEIISIFGSNMGPTPGLGFTPLNGKIDVNLAGTQVFFDNVAAPLIFVSANQINAIVPYEVASLLNTGIGTKVTVVRGGVTSAQFVVGVTATSPAIFSALQTGNGQGAILNQNLSANSVSNPEVRGRVVSIYATGEGSLTPFVASGTISGPTLPLPKPIANVQVTIGGQPALVSYQGEAPGLVSGVIQVNAQIPTNIGSGPQQVILTIGGGTNNTQIINVAVQ